MKSGHGAPNFGAILERQAVERPRDVFLVEPDGATTTYGAFHDLAWRAASHLNAKGVRRGDRVVTICRNQLAFFAAAYGAWAVGAILVPLNHEQRGSILAALLANAQSTLTLVDAFGRESIASLPPHSSNVAGRIAELADILQPQSGSPISVDSADPEQAALILYSSGTTGVSKGCVLSHDHLVYTGEEFCRAADMRATDSVYSPGPMFHSNSWWAFSGTVVGGVRHAFDLRFSASQFWSRASATQATLFDYVGAMIAILLRSPQNPGPDCRVRAALGGAARPQEAQAFFERFNIPLLECYGLTECCLPVFQRESELRIGSIGKLSGYFDARLVDEQQVDVGPNAPGELWLRPHEPRAMFMGYWQRPDLTQAAFSDGWFRTGDICRIDPDGYFHYLDRKRHFIRRRGENISPFEVEGILFDHPQVANCAVIGVPSDLGEEDVLLAVQPKEDESIDPHALWRWCRERMASYMTPRYIRVMRLPLTPSERVEKHKLREDGVQPDVFDAQAHGANPSGDAAGTTQ
jgi:crotonobetaine/carnitine-CoA ligase